MNSDRLLARILIYDGEVHPLSLITPHGDGQFTVEPFTAETPGTVFENEPLALIPEFSPLPSGRDLHEIILSLRAPHYLLNNQKLKLIHLTPDGCHDYTI